MTYSLKRFIQTIKRGASHALAVMVVIAVFAAGCAPATLAPGASPPAATTPPTLGPKVIPFFTTETDLNQLAVLQELIAEYQKLNPQVEVDIVQASPASRGRRLLTALASGADLGIFEIEPTLMNDWAEAGYLLPLDDVASAIGEGDFVAGSLFRYQGRVFALPYAISVYGLWVRTDWFAEAGLPLPTTYDEVLLAAETLTRGQRYGIALPGGQNIATVNYFSTFLWQNGGDYFSCDGAVTFGEPAAFEAVRRWHALTQYAPPGFTTWGFSEQIEAFIKGRVAMAMYGGRLGVQLAKSAPELEDKVVVVFPPWGPERVTLGVWSRFAIAAGTRNQTEAKAFLQWLLSGDRLLRYDMTLPGHMIPPLHSVQALTTVEAAPYVKRHGDWIAAFNEWAAYTNHPAMNMGSVQGGHFSRSDVVAPWAQDVFGTPGIVDTMLQEITLGGRPLEEAWQDAGRRMEAVVQQWQAAHPDWVPPSC